MKTKAKLIDIKLDDLVLDINNPRFAELYSGSEKEDDLIEYLLYTEAAEEVAKAIVNANEFYPDRPLWVIIEGGEYIVKDGNRRCSAVKALQMPGKFKLGLPKTIIEELPVLLYENQKDIDARIVEEHAGNLFRRWERIAKALEVLKLSDAGRFEEVKELDSKPGDLIKLASFYKKAVVIGGDDLRILLRRGRGKTGGKTIIFERLFRNAKECGYYFRNSPSFKIEVTDSTKFSSYVLALINYLKDNPSTTTETIDRNPKFLELLKPYGFDVKAKGATTGTGTSSGSTTGTTISTAGTTTAGTAPSGTTGTLSTAGTTTVIATASTSGTGSSSAAGATTGTASTTSIGGTRGSTKKFPITKRKALPPGIKERIKEYFELDSNNYSNSKVAMARVTFEVVLKYVVENTKFNGRTTMNKTSYFGRAYGSRRFTDFNELRLRFIDLIKNTGFKNAFNSFDLDQLHQIVHNYHVSAVSTAANQISNNLMVLIEFLLQDEADLLNELDITKL
ncbi:hypothetical protein I2I11_13045 [Pontibacter sp. 172403-2]|uniref:hypothetical protein n=1 Tax=Pontibacter rufus TaxID=2791028 RepID=UPI0018AFB93F|nr:hypothetical protein [Pontibacter sp. 172403-2]MBF9254225.1 hypothetical protein [Pontibacter sp. 172403-2]